MSKNICTTYTHKYCTDLIEAKIYKHTRLTANETIDRIFEDDLTHGLVNAVDRGWKFYVHLNKLFTVMERQGRIKHIGEKIGPTQRKEKVWELI